MAHRFISPHALSPCFPMRPGKAKGDRGLGGGRGSREGLGTAFARGVPKGPEAEGRGGGNVRLTVAGGVKELHVRRSVVRAYMSTRARVPSEFIEPPRA